MIIKRLKTLILCIVLCVAVTAQPQQAKAEVDPYGDVFATIFLVLGAGSALNLTSIIASSYYLGSKKYSPLGWQIFSYTVGGLTFGTGVALMASDSVEVGGVFAAVGATTLTLSILAAVLNKPKKQPSVVFSPILLRDVEGGLAPGVGFSLMSF